MYSALKLFHISCMLTSFSLFSLRSYWMWHNILQKCPPWMKRLPHMVDTLLLASGLGLISITHFTPFNSPWLALKLSLLLAYILLGSVTLSDRFGPQNCSRKTRAYFGLLASFCFLSMLYLARFKPPLW